MKFIKIQQDLIKNIVTEKGETKSVQEYGDDLIAVINKFNVYFIPRTLWFLDTEKFNNRYSRKFDIEHLLSYLKDSVLAEATGEMKKREEGRRKITLVKISSKDECCWVDEKLLKMFEDPIFAIKGDVNTVRVYENNVLVGLVCPYITKTKDE